MKNAIFQVFNGDLLGYGKCLKATEHYCYKHDIRLYRSFYTKLSDRDFSLEKIMSLGLLHMFDRVLSLDGDIMITPDARNIFEMYPEEDTLYAYHENDSNDHMDRSKYIAEVHGDLDWPTMSNECKQYFNAGVMLWSKGCFKDPKDIETFADSVWQVPKKQNTFYFGEQTALNYAVVKNNIKFSSISHSFNRMDLGNFDPSCDRYTADFIHYAGPCKYALPGESKRDCMERDYKALYDKK